MSLKSRNETRAMWKRSAELRADGKTFAEIGEILGMSPARAREKASMYKSGMRTDEFGDLPSAIGQALYWAGMTTREQVREWIEGPNRSKIHNIGARSMATIKAWL